MSSSNSIVLSEKPTCIPVKPSGHRKQVSSNMTTKHKRRVDCKESKLRAGPLFFISLSAWHHFVNQRV